MLGSPESAYLCHNLLLAYRFYPCRRELVRYAQQAI